MAHSKTRIKHISDLPKWFKITKYDQAKYLDLVGWHQQLSIRQELENLIGFQKDGIDDEFTKEFQYYTNIPELIRQTPIVDITSNQQLLDYFYYLTTKKFSLGVRPLTIEKFIRIEKSLDPEKLNSFRLCYDNSFYYMHPLRKQINEPLQSLAKPLTSESHSVAYIDWNLPDALLIEHFKQYLNIHRQDKSENKKQYRKPDFNNWYRFGVLPYLDLQTWAIENDITIPNRVMADAVFPHGTQGEETIRKTTAPLAETLQTDEALELLASQASLEIAEQNNR